MTQRKKKQEDGADGLRWLTTYGDVVTLLLAFFVMLYAISQVDQQKFQLFVSGLEVPFGNVAGSGSVLDGDSGLASDSGAGPLPADPSVSNIDEGLGLIDGGETIREATTTTMATAIPSSTTTLPDDIIRTAEELLMLQAEVSASLDLAGLNELVDFTIDSRGLVIAVATDDVLFPSGSTDVTQIGEQIVDVLGPTLARIGNTLLVEGHTDSVPLLRPGYDNWNLSTDRAVAVLHILTDGYGIDPTRLAATGYGEYQPRAGNDTEEGKSLNRRIELVVVAETG